MDAQHRHELKTNELADWLTHLPQFLKKNTNTIIGVGLICVGLITWPLFNKMGKEKNFAEQTEMTQSIQMLGQDVGNVIQAPAEDVLLQTEALNTMLLNAESLLDKASDIENPNLAAMAQIKAAQAIRTQLHLRKTLDAETLETQIQKAQDAYQQAFENAQTKTLKAMAQFGLGLCSEELGQVAQAGEIYQQIVDNEDYQTTVLPAQAQQRLDGLEENAESFIFAQPPVVEIESVTEMTDQDAVESIMPESKTATEDVSAVAEDSGTSVPADETAEASGQSAQPEITE